MDKRDAQHEAMTYTAKEPNVVELRNAYEDTLTQLSGYIQQCRESYDDRRNFWPGKSRDLRKHGAAPFPWEGASDMEAHVIDERINTYVCMFMAALSRANIRAFPVESGDMARARIVSGFLKWMVSSYIPNFRKEMELAANYMLERGIAITYVGWNREQRTYIQTLSLDQLPPELAQQVITGEADDILMDMLMRVYPALSEKRARKAIGVLKRKGIAEITVSRPQVDQPIARTLSPDGDFFFPPYIEDPQRSPYCFWRTYFTPQELQNKVVTEGWNQDWVDYVIEHYRGQNTHQSEREGRTSHSFTDTTYQADEIIEVVYVYQRLIDREDNSEGIYCTIIHRESGKSTSPLYAKHELMNGMEDYPVVVTRLWDQSKRLYDVQTMPELLRGVQGMVKVERDSRIDRNSLATVPPIMHPIGNVPSDWGPGRKIAYRRGGEFQFGPVPQFNQGSVEMERTMISLADSLVGLDAEDPIGNIKRQFYVDKFLFHCQQVIKKCFKSFQRWGPDEVWFRVTGIPDPQKFDKGNPEENYDTVVGYDVLNQDPETQEAKLQQLVSLLQIDRNGRIDVDRLLDVAAGAIDPILADMILQPAEVAQQKVMKDVTDDLAKIFAGIEMPARPNGAQVAIQLVQQYAQQQDVAGRMAQDETFKERLTKYHDQYQFMLQQAQNAQIGKVGTEPAQMGGAQTQSLQ